MQSMERVLLVTMGFGTGHNAAAQAVEEAVRQPGTMAKTVDLLEMVPGTFHPLLQSGYNRMLTRFPSFYHVLYDGTSQSRLLRSVSHQLIEKMGWMIRKKLNQLLSTFQPTRLIATHPFSLWLIPPEWRQLPSTGVVTDYDIHPLWLIRMPDLLCLPPGVMDREGRERLRRQTGSQVLETGIPCGTQFQKCTSRQEARTRLGLDPEIPMLLVMGGGLGHGPLYDIVGALCEISFPLRIQVMTGKNEKMYQELTSTPWKGDVHVEGYRKDIHLWLDAADLLVTKPGGMSITEAMLKRVPLLLFQALPGQEFANQQYLVRQGGALAVQPDTVQRLVRYLFAYPDLRRWMADRLGQLATPDAARRIAEESLQAKPFPSAL